MALNKGSCFLFPSAGRYSNVAGRERWVTQMKDTGVTNATLAHPTKITLTSTSPDGSSQSAAVAERSKTRVTTSSAPEGPGGLGGFRPVATVRSSKNRNPCL